MALFLKFLTDGTSSRNAGGRSRPTRRRSMDWNRVEGNWKQAKGKVKEQWGKLTDDDLDVIAGKQDQLEGRLQQRYGYAKDATATPRIRRRRKSTTGMIARSGRRLRTRKGLASAGPFFFAVAQDP